MSEEIRDRILEAAGYTPLEHPARPDDCGFSPFRDDTSTSRETAFAKIRARVRGHGTGFGSNWRWMMQRNESEENCSIPPRSRPRTRSCLPGDERSRNCLRRKQELERKTKELAHSLAMMRATLESTTDGILVTDYDGQVTGYNQQFLDRQTVGYTRSPGHRNP